MTALPLEPHTEAKEATLARFEGAAPAFRETTVDRLGREHFGLAVSVPERQVSGYLYAIHDDFNDGYPSRTLILVSSDASEAPELEFSDSDPAGYPKTMRTPCLVENVPSAAIEAMCGKSAAEEALARVEALAEALGDESREFYYDNRHTHEYGISYVSGMSDAMEQIADRITAAIAASVAQAGEGR